MKNKQKYIRDLVCLHPTRRYNVVVETRIDNNNGWWGIPPIITNMLCNDITVSFPYFPRTLPNFPLHKIQQMFVFVVWNVWTWLWKVRTVYCTNVQKGKGSLPTKIVIVKIAILLYLLYSENHNLWLILPIIIKTIPRALVTMF